MFTCWLQGVLFNYLAVPAVSVYILCDGGHLYKRVFGRGVGLSNDIPVEIDTITEDRIFDSADVLCRLPPAPNAKTLIEQFKKDLNDNTPPGGFSSLLD